MEDKQIVELYWQRQEQAIRETDRRYGKTLLGLAYRILSDREDSHECVNDTYLHTWNSLPPHKPDSLGAYVTRLVRHTAIDRYRRRKAEKRCGSEYALSLEELAECVSGRETPQTEAEAAALAKTIGTWLSARPEPVQQAFMQRYFYAESLETIARRLSMPLGSVKSLLFRARQDLRTYLEQEGWTV